MFESHFWIPLAIVGSFLALVFILKYGWLWFQARACGVPVSVFALVGMSIRKIPARLIVENLIAARRAGVDLRTVDLEGLYLAGGHVTNVVRAMIVGKKLPAPLDFKTACAIDLAGKDVLGLVMSVDHPKTIQCKDPFTGADIVEARAGDGVPIRVKASLVVRPCLARVLGGGDEAVTVEAATRKLIALIAGRPGEEVLARPAAIGEELVAHPPESGTAFEIVSVDILTREG